ncbi:hypothetical protein FZ025_04525 [Xanthomonas hyacinthi]|uniref:Uncharacterized protein n=2 Tax=Xanthomonas hyacinthi TaxID=56455 RepID=A0A2S7F391_9XANT|nr:hypothetical protein Y886_16055 [Xanthomonas hyacinthi DSM 19077]PPU99807.1 hypothetical protein XhyaCFBP1156_01180 [Xanthomonas hyacinthi]QGY75963.1 hypothetical protein FZ025_04525 [Xanthomonas hyacinthi]
MSTAGMTTTHGADGANTEASGSGAQAPAEALRAHGAPIARSNVFRSPLSAGSADSDLRRRARRTQLATRVAAIGTVAALATVALLAWRRARR